jgi:hypothetical protein
MLSRKEFGRRQWWPISMYSLERLGKIAEPSARIAIILIYIPNTSIMQYLYLFIYGLFKHAASN